MNEKRFTIHKESKYKEEWYDYPFCIKEDGDVVFNTIPLSIALKVRDKLNEQQATIKQLQDKLFAMQHTIDNQENAIFYLKDTDDNLRKKNIRIEELSKVVHNLKMVLSSDDEQVAKIVGEQQATINELKAQLREKEEDEKLYANEILELREANKEFIQFKELGGDY